ncbi:PREDICTED: uncharacterized protein LOC104793860 [Camelina sativa]|uniref:Uncharacterized protein LOC104793860 n=1 Tax=Camelina sativa TaxID=90675 RepID=A0ABM0ZPA7_CAMSA|nr:PREDICTED: uncharacterized protein LOC104793860 [Camelina sativa]
MVTRIVHEWLTYIASKVYGKLSLGISAEEPNIPIAGTTLRSRRSRVDFVFITNESQEIPNVSTTSQELPSSSASPTTLTAHSSERSNSLRSIVIQ